jgi:hypothetical protein
METKNFPFVSLVMDADRDAARRRPWRETLDAPADDPGAGLRTPARVMRVHLTIWLLLKWALNSTEAGVLNVRLRHQSLSGRDNPPR